jgi:hypothetical protein
MIWEIAKKYFKDQGGLVDIYYENMTTFGWEELFRWLSSNPNVASVNCYLPESDENLEELPKGVASHIDDDGFYCFVSVLVGDMTLFLRFYEKAELECDVSPSEMDSEENFSALINILDEIKMITGSPRYLICPESSKGEAFIINGELVG